MKSTKLGTRALAGVIAVVISGLMVVAIDSLANYCGGGAAGQNGSIARSEPARHQGTSMRNRT